MAWLGLVSYSALATHATATTAIAAIERTGSWKMEIRSDTKAELATVEKRLEVLSQPKVPAANTIRSPRHLQLRKWRPACGVTVRNAKAFAEASIFNRPVARCLGCAVNWRGGF